MIYIIDAYNAIHKIQKLESMLNKDLRSARSALTQLCSKLVCARGDISKIILVFDGKSEFRDLASDAPPKIDLVFTETGESADERIVALLAQPAKGKNRCVVSDDNYVRNQARAFQTRVMSVSEFTQFVNSSNKKKRNEKSPSDSFLLSSRIAHEITEAYKKELGL